VVTRVIEERVVRSGPSWGGVLVGAALVISLATLGLVTVRAYDQEAACASPAQRKADRGAGPGQHHQVAPRNRAGCAASGHRPAGAAPPSPGLWWPPMTFKHKPRAAQRRMLLMVAAPLSLMPVLQGCVSATPPEQTGIRVGDATMAQFKAGVTTEAWLLAILGPPTSSAAVDGVENTKVLRYATGEGASGLGSIFSGKASRNTAVVYFVITDGIVTRFWADRATERTLLGDQVEESSGGLRIASSAILTPRNGGLCRQARCTPRCTARPIPLASICRDDRVPSGSGGGEPDRGGNESRRHSDPLVQARRVAGDCNSGGTLWH
jgi:hypothetical protein